MDKIIIADLEVFYHVGVPDTERARPQRLLVTVELARDVTAATATDELTKTIDYYSVSRRLLRFGEGRNWKLIETLANDIASMVLDEFRPVSVMVEVKKFAITEAHHVAVQVLRSRGEQQ